MSKEITLKTVDNTTENEIDQQIASHVDIVRGIQERIAVLEERIQLEKEVLRGLLTEKGENWSDTEGYARLLADSVRRTYDIKALDELIISDPLRNGWLKDYRRETTVRGGIQVK
jgi:hypothetical protein